SAAAWCWRRRFLAAERRRKAEVAEQHARDQAAREAEAARMATILDGMIEGLVVVDAEGRIAVANRAAETMFGFSRMMVGGSLLAALRHHEVAARATRAASERSAIEHEIRVEAPQPRILQVSAAAVRDAEGGTAGTVLVFHDVTQLRQLEAMRQDFV